LEEKVNIRTEELKELVEKQEKIVEERTEELQEKVQELERFNRLAVGRELKMIELKNTIKKLEKGKDKKEE
jgi:nitrate/nitrite-specific signal transduction histidine kinase